MKLLFVIPLCFNLFAFSQNIDTLNFFKDDNLYIEYVVDSSKNNPYNNDNTIFVSTQTYRFNFTVKDSLGQFICFGNSNGEIDKYPHACDSSIYLSYYTLKTFDTYGPFEKYRCDYNQSVVEYKLFNSRDSSWTKEMTGVVENQMNLWLHPNRNNYFKILELNPFPYVVYPLELGKKWSWTLQIGDNYADPLWKTWYGTIDNRMEYQVTDSLILNTPAGALPCWKIESTASSQLGQTSSIFYFNPQYGFVKSENLCINGNTFDIVLESVYQLDNRPSSAY